MSSRTPHSGPSAGHVLGGGGSQQARDRMYEAHESSLAKYIEKERQKKWKKLEEKLNNNPALKAATDIGHKLNCSEVRTDHGAAMKFIRQLQQETYMERQQNPENNTEQVPTMMLQNKNSWRKLQAQLEKNPALKAATEVGNKLANDTNGANDLAIKMLREHQQERYNSQLKRPVQ